MRKQEHFWKIIGLIGLLMARGSVDGQAQTSAAGQVLTVVGHVAVGHGKVSPQICLGLDQLRAGDTLTASRGASATVVLYENGARFVLSGDSKVQVQQSTLQALSGPAPRALKALSRAFCRPMPQASQRLGPRFGGEVARITQDPRIGPRHAWPIGAVRETIVRLRWDGPMEPETEKIRLQINDSASGKTLYERDVPVETREFVVPAELLKPGHWYGWSVAAVGKNGTGQRCEGSVRRLTSQERAELERAEQEAQRMHEANLNDPTPDLLLAQKYERLGLSTEAQEAYETALWCGSNPGAEAALKRLKH